MCMCNSFERQFKHPCGPLESNLDSPWPSRKLPEGTRLALARHLLGAHNLDTLLRASPPAEV